MRGRSLRILKVANIPPGRQTGMGRVMHETADALATLGHTVDLMFDDDVPRRGRGTAADRVAFPLAVVTAVKRWSRDRGAYDVVEIHEPSAAAYAYRRRHGRAVLPPLAVMSHGLEATAWAALLDLDRRRGRRTPLRNRLATPLTRLPIARYGLTHAEQVMCLNADDRAFLTARYGLGADRVTLVSNGVENPCPPAEVRRRSDGPLRLLAIGTWLEKKGRQELAAALAILNARRPGGVRLTVMGTGVDADAVRSTFATPLRRLVDVVPRFMPTELHRAFAEHDVFVSAAFYEPWGLAVTEAAAAGLPVVTTRAAGPASLFVDGESALFVPVADAPALADAVDRLWADPALRTRLVAGARAVAKRLTWQAAAESHLRAYRSAIAHHRASSE